MSFLANINSLCESLQCDVAAFDVESSSRSCPSKEGARIYKEPFWLPIEVVAIRSALMTRLGFKVLDYSAAYPVLDASEVAAWVPDEQASEWKKRSSLCGFELFSRLLAAVRYNCFV